MVAEMPLEMPNMKLLELLLTGAKTPNVISLR